MTVKELIEHLKTFPENAPVAISIRQRGLLDEPDEGRTWVSNEPQIAIDSENRVMLSEVFPYQEPPQETWSPVLQFARQLADLPFRPMTDIERKQYETESEKPLIAKTEFCLTVIDGEMVYIRELGTFSYSEEYRVICPND